MPVIEPFDYLRTLPEIEAEVTQALHRVLHSNALILGPETAAFESEFADYVGAEHAVAVTSGTMALQLAMQALGAGHGGEVITVANTCVPTVSAIRSTGAAPVFVDVRDDDLMVDVAQVEAALTERTRCIVPVHLWGGSADLDALRAVAEKANVPIVEDCAQAAGTLYRERHVGTFGAAGCFSFYPTKNLGAYGDGGAVVTNDAELAARLKRIRMYGYDGSPVAIEEGTNGRIAEMQAAILRIKLRRFPDWLGRRLAVADSYNRQLTNDAVSRPRFVESCRPSYHQYVVRTPDRDRLIAHLEANGIGFGIHYPVPIHQMDPYRRYAPPNGLPTTDTAANDILSLPIHEGLTYDETQAVVGAINGFR